MPHSKEAKKKKKMGRWCPGSPRAPYDGLLARPGCPPFTVSVCLQDFYTVGLEKRVGKGMLGFRDES